MSSGTVLAIKWLSELCKKGAKMIPGKLARFRGTIPNLFSRPSLIPLLITNTIQQSATSAMSGVNRSKNDSFPLAPLGARSFATSSFISCIIGVPRNFENYKSYSRLEFGQPSPILHEAEHIVGSCASIFGTPTFFIV
jgi:hypothetical protein